MSVGPRPALLKSGAGFDVAARFANKRNAFTTFELIRYCIADRKSLCQTHFSKGWRAADQRTVIDLKAWRNAAMIDQVSAKNRVLRALLEINPADSDMVVLRHRITEGHPAAGIR